MLTQGNLLHQTGHRLGPSLPYEESEPLPGEKMLSLLPGEYRIIASIVVLLNREQRVVDSPSPYKQKSLILTNQHDAIHTQHF